MTETFKPGSDEKWRAESCALAEASRQRMATIHKPPAANAALHGAAGKIVEARMIGSGVQPRTIADRDVVVTPTDFKAIVTGRDGEERTEAEASKVLALFDRSACAVFRLAHDGLLAATGAVAAVVFAEAGDRVMGGARVRTVNFDGVRGGHDGLNETDKDRIARWRWDVARLRLSRVQFRILDGVMRHDEGAEAAGRAAYPKIAAKMKIIGMADQALIDACDLLAVEYGFEKSQTDSRSLAGL